MNQTKEAQH